MIHIEFLCITRYIWKLFCIDSGLSGHGSDRRGALLCGVSLGLDPKAGRDWWMGRASRGGTNAWDDGPFYFLTSFNTQPGCARVYVCLGLVLSLIHTWPGGAQGYVRRGRMAMMLACYIHGLFAATNRDSWSPPLPFRCIGLRFPSGHDLRDSSPPCTNSYDLAHCVILD